MGLTLVFGANFSPPMLPLDVDTDWNSAVSGIDVIVSGTISFLGRYDVGVDICLSCNCLGNLDGGDLKLKVNNI